MFRRKNNLSNYITYHGIVSILVLLDVSSEVSVGGSRVIWIPVSILVLLDVSSEVSVGGSRVIWIPVSILVLLDVSSEDSISNPSYTGTACFNPCSLGCIVGRTPFESVAL